LVFFYFPPIAQMYYWVNVCNFQFIALRIIKQNIEGNFTAVGSILSFCKPITVPQVFHYSISVYTGVISSLLTLHIFVSTVLWFMCA
jgi:hypothetical protein